MVNFKGQLSFGLLNIPIELHKTIEGKNVNNPFHYADKNGNPLKQFYLDNEGNKYTSGQITHYSCEFTEKLFTKEEKESIKLPNTKELKVIGLIDSNSINPLMAKNEYVYQLTPQTIKDKGFIGVKPYNLLLKGLMKMGKGLISKVVLNSKEKHLVIYPQMNKLIAQVINYKEELREFISVPESEIKEEELNLIEQVLTSSQNVRIDELKDSNLERLKELIEKKISGEEIEIEKEEKPQEEEDFLNALKTMVSAK